MDCCPAPWKDREDGALPLQSLEDAELRDVIIAATVKRSSESYLELYGRFSILFTVTIGVCSRHCTRALVMHSQLGNLSKSVCRNASRNACVSKLPGPGLQRRCVSISTTPSGSSPRTDQFPINSSPSNTEGPGMFLTNSSSHG